MLKRMLIMFSDKQHLVVYQQSVSPDDQVLHMEVFTGFKKHVKSASGSFSFLPFSATFCRLKPVKTGKWQKTLFAGRNANPDFKYDL